MDASKPQIDAPPVLRYHRGTSPANGANRMDQPAKDRRIAELRQIIADVHHGKREGNMLALVNELNDLTIPAEIRARMAAR